MKAALFDFDGTIVFSENLWMATFDQFEIDYSLPLTPHEVRLQQMTRSVLSLAKEYYSLYPSLGSTFSSAEALAKYFNDKTETTIYSTEPIKGVDRFIQLLNERGVPVVIASSGRKEHISAYLSKWDIQVKDIVTGDDVEHPKPAPDVYFEALRRAGPGLKPQDAVVFEDNPNPAYSAYKSGFSICAVNYNNRSIFSEDFPPLKCSLSDFDNSGELFCNLYESC
ncbi:2-deoxyglucose-6-phosphate phosphatase, putative [Entamoeba invadens IP1]|uniref:2-deoxyglucose-6-phosphate phosphatase, putative n=1 Tax=Entamoeba invadens IP1 TaxID=370355 RepID=A0A0A1U135_ENTIV|nr:2-deoxyglucose-6-phosphate phosphatase, putative [Entamoeba invadens IP1]ELP84618.1 2-deoxyglucose-6-phosphate phosphatase, putative [Entamoeba invadens IP1]|eukprot:XP_004183964.1 2-deoxyglucose-6-phosphate phosphatase, putative [Entamoeba invadens IP1]